MRMQHRAIRGRVFVVWLALTGLLLVLSASRSATAQIQPRPYWNRFAQPAPYDTSLAWAGYNQDFYTIGAEGGDIFANQQGGTAFCKDCFWEEAEEIELAEDAYGWAIRNGVKNLRSYADEVNALCLGFIDNAYAVNKGPDGPYDLSGDDFNDDLDWAVIAFARAFQITRNPDWLQAAEINFNTVWTRGQDPGGSGDGKSGLIQSQPHGSGWTPNLDSPVNFTFVIAGYLIYGSTHNPAYKQEANNVYAWAIANLYRTTVNDGAGPGVCVGHPELTCAKIYDSTTGHSDYTYDYGIAIDAAAREGDAAKAQYITNWLMYNSNNPNYPYAGTYGGYNILPNYHQGGDNDDGYNGIALRGVGYALSRGILHGGVWAWARANVEAAWQIRNADGVMWNNWTPNSASAETPANGLYSWDCTPALAGIFDIPAFGREAPWGLPPNAR